MPSALPMLQQKWREGGKAVMRVTCMKPPCLQHFKVGSTCSPIAIPSMPSHACITAHLLQHGVLTWCACPPCPTAG